MLMWFDGINLGKLTYLQDAPVYQKVDGLGMIMGEGLHIILW